ncbi:ATP-dependent caseinolytic protease/crotonase family protein [Prunus dulcis]|uniref:ATP-dependent caseinolytic protease/crotonase family protein n=1 Tax=Prunus dulcis TaxID=3755 RepID=A0A4Y1RWS5_PRUDU|nr:ATP-dependent caseinolytic protease/crotonase family protein [Prunus dulcis]
MGIIAGRLYYFLNRNSVLDPRLDGLVHFNVNGMQPHDERNEKMRLWRNIFVSSRMKREHPFQDLEELH